MGNRTLRRVWSGVGLSIVVAGVLPAQNSTRKIRNAPSELAARAGSAVPWRASVDAALAEAKTSGKPVFWYVPSVARSPMDRKDEIDRYLMGGPFSWPSTIALLQDHFVPVKEVASGARAKAMELVRGTFIEPGYVVLDGDGKVLLQLDQITTFHPQWFETPLRRLVGQPIERFPCEVALTDAWAAAATSRPSPDSSTRSCSRRTGPQRAKRAQWKGSGSWARRSSDSGGATRRSCAGRRSGTRARRSSTSGPSFPSCTRPRSSSKATARSCTVSRSTASCPRPF
jgi:hypothetical protein